MGWAYHKQALSWESNSWMGAGIYTFPERPKVTDGHLVIECFYLRLHVIGKKAVTVGCTCVANISAEYSTFLESLDRILDRELALDIVLPGDLNSHAGETGKRLIARNRLPQPNPSGVLSLIFCASNGLSKTNTMFKHNAVC